MKKALVIGINDYVTSPLKGCINDAEAVASLLAKNGDGSPNFDVQLKTDTKIKSDLKELIVELFAGNGNTALFYFSGHGDLNSTGGYVVTPDFRKYDEGVSMDDILKLANNSKIQDKIIILDCCSSGSFGSSSPESGVTMSIGEGVSILTACRGEELAYEINGHGIFTGLFLDALQGGAADLRGFITPGAIYAYIDQALGPWNQRPVFKTNITRFTPIRTINPHVTLEVLRKIIDYFPTPEYEYPLDPSYEDTNGAKANAKNVAVFKHLQKFQSVNLVVPVGEEFMYFAAQNNKSCRLTATGYHYWRLAKENRL